MKKYTGFIVVFAVLCLIPAIVYQVFSDHSKDNGGAFPSGASISGTSYSIERQNGLYNILLEPTHPPLKRGKQVIKLIIRRIDGSPVAPGIPEVHVAMLMGANAMNASVNVKNLAASGQYNIETDFSMAGRWTISIKPTASAAPVTIPVEAQE